MNVRVFVRSQCFRIEMKGKIRMEKNKIRMVARLCTSLSFMLLHWIGFTSFDCDATYFSTADMSFANSVIWNRSNNNNNNNDNREKRVYEKTKNRTKYSNWCAHISPLLRPPDYTLAIFDRAAHLVRALDPLQFQMHAIGCNFRENNELITNLISKSVLIVENLHTK